jgi:hypothetical protein
MNYSGTVSLQANSRASITGCTVSVLDSRDFIYDHFALHFTNYLILKFIVVLILIIITILNFNMI